MTIDEIRLVVRLARKDLPGVARCLAAGRCTPDRLADAALAEGLAVLLLRALPSLPPGFEVPSVQRDALESRNRLQALRSARLAEALGRLADRFDAAGQAFLLLKGPYVATRFYGDPRGREYIDLDLLVPTASRARACRLVEAAGYLRQSRLIGGERLTSLFVHGFDFAAHDANIDLHWCLSRHPSVHVDEGALFPARETYPVGGRRFGVLSAEIEVVFHALSLLRDIERGRPKAKNIIDLVQILASSDARVDWNTLLGRGHGDGTWGPLVNVLTLCLDLADARDLAPRLSAALARHAYRLVPARPTAVPGHFAPTHLGIGNRWWAARTYDTSLSAWLLWWATSLPFRAAVHHRGLRRPPPVRRAGPR